jgi:hypothetical protein
VRLYAAPKWCVTRLAERKKFGDPSELLPDLHMRNMSFASLIRHFYLLVFSLTITCLAQSDCEKDGDTSTYDQNGLVISFKNLCGKDIEAPLDYSSSPEPKRSDCINRCVEQAPLCYGFDYTPYVSSSQNNCYLMNGTFEASNATYRNFVADAAMLDPNLVVRLPQSCQRLSLRDCFEQNSQPASNASSSAPAPSSSSTFLSGATTSAPTASSTGSGHTTGDSEGLSTGAKAGIGAGIGLVALIAILSGILIVLKRVKRKRAAASSAGLSAETQQAKQGNMYLQHKAGSQTCAHIDTSSLELASGTEEVYEIDGRARHEK